MKPGLFTESLVNGWAVDSFFEISLGSLGSKPRLFADSLVDGWAVIFFFGISSRTRPLYWVACRPRMCCSFLFLGGGALVSCSTSTPIHPLHPPPRSRSSGSTPGLRCWVSFKWVGRSFLLRNRIKVLRFHSRRLSWGPVVDRWAVFSFFGIILRSLGSTAGVFAESVVAG